MKAIIYHGYGLPCVLELEEIEKPVVRQDQVLVRLHAAAVNWLDWHFLTGTPVMARLLAGLLKPKHKVLGIDLAGRVEKVGAYVRQFQPGDAVFGSTGHGCFAEYVCVSQEELVMKPVNMTFEEVAAVPGAAVTALRGVRDYGQIQPGQNVLINGASGGVGTFAVQIAQALGAKVTGVCSTRNLELLRTIGAEQVIDYTQQDYTQNGQQYDLIFDAVAKRAFSDCRRVLGPKGIYVTTAFSPALVLTGLWTSRTGSKKLVPLPPNPPTQKDLVFIKELLEAGKVKPIIDRRYALSEVPEALRYLSTGRARGKIVITI